jgi:hypothetical protein
MLLYGIAGFGMAFVMISGQRQCRCAAQTIQEERGANRDMVTRLKDWLADRANNSTRSPLDVKGRGGLIAASRAGMDPGRAPVVSPGPAARMPGGTERPKILVAGDRESFPECVVDYTVHLAERLDYDILAMHVGRLPEEAASLPHQGRVTAIFEKKAAAAGEVLRRKALQKGIHCEQVVKFGALGAAVAGLHHGVKRIEFVITDSEANKDEISVEVTIPVFSVTPSTWWSEQGGKTMATEQAAKRNRPIGKTIMFGIGTVAIYAAVFSNADMIMKYFTRGSWYAALPIATVFLVSFVHGAFASNLWSTLGIDARKKETAHKTVEKVVQPQKQLRKKPRAYAYVNPWHRM